MRRRWDRAGVGTCGVVVASAAGIREGVVGIVDLLEFLRAGWAGGVVVGYAVGVVLQGCSERGVSKEEGRRGKCLRCGGGGSTVCRPHGFGFGLRWRKPREFHLGFVRMCNGAEEGWLTVVD